MVKDYRFKEIEKYLKKSSETGEEILDAFDMLSEATILFSPIIFGPQLLPLLKLLDVKDRLSTLSHKVYDAITQKLELDYIERAEQIRAAYALISYTSYFDVLEDSLPNQVRKKLKLKFEEKKALIEDSSGNLGQTQRPQPDIRCKLFYADHVTSFSEIKKDLLEVYLHITNKLIDVVKDAKIFDEEKQNEKRELDKLIESLQKLPDKAILVYEAQYIKLADEFNDFALFAQIQNFDGIHRAITKNKDALDLLAGVTKKIDVGLNDLNSIVNSIATNFSSIQSQDIVDDLKNKYLSFIEDPIIDDKEIKCEAETLTLNFPKIKDAFIPQSFKCLSYQDKETKLEDALLWKSLSTQHDLDNFFIKYLYSPDSVDYPLIILGHPGSGKSLLTKILSAQLMSNSYTVVRIPLRDINAEDGIDVLVEDQIKKLTNRPLAQGYGGFASQFNEKPLIIILDGYDELLQAKGDVFSGYLEKVRMFQQDQKSLKRPVRVIITSRVTLIDKARIPINSTILRLMEFDQRQRQAWIDIWNNINIEYFLSSNVKPFSLPPKEKGTKNNILELAEQPLLLLMLAIYDSEANELAQTSTIKRTELYDNLLRRFVRRERSRYVPGFVDKPEQEQQAIVEQEMNRLGVVAIGMYNRQEVVIQSRQLEEDIELYNAHRHDGSSKPHSLKESESVLGGFFFIHKSTAKDLGAHSDRSESAYEFLHNTFGEFLAADFILRNTIKEVIEIYIDRQYKPNTIANKLANPDSLDPKWFYCLMFVPLYSRPVVVEMLREHVQKALQCGLKNYKSALTITNNDFVDNLEFLVHNQLNMVLNTRKTSSVMRNGVISDRDIPLLGYLSIYSLNLIILACTLSPDGFTFDENEFYHDELSKQEAKPWEKLISLWKSWFAPSDLVGLSVILNAKRKNDSTIKITCNKTFEATRYDQPIDILLSISSTLADNLLLGLSGLQTQRFDEITRMTYKDVRNALKDQSPDLHVSYLITHLRQQIAVLGDNYQNITHFGSNYKKANDLVETIIHVDGIQNLNQNTRLNLFEALGACLQRDILFFSTRRNILLNFVDLVDISRIRVKKLPDASELLSAVRLLKLLLQKTGIIILDRRIIYMDPFFDDERFDFPWLDQIEQIIRYSSRIEISSMHWLRKFNLSDSYHIFNDFSVYKNILVDDLEYAKTFMNEISEDVLEVLLRTNPEIPSYYIKLILQRQPFSGNLDSEMVDHFLRICLEELRSVGFTCFGFRATINVISIAQHVKADDFLASICHLIRRHLFITDNKFFPIIFQLYPSFISELIDILPEVFLDVSDGPLLKNYIDRDYVKIYIEKLLYLIGILRKLHHLANQQQSYEKVFRNTWKMLERIIHNSDTLQHINYQKLTLGQIDDLLWYANAAGEVYVSQEINSILSKV